MKIIDAHAHIFPGKISKKATNSISEFYSNIPMAHEGSVEALLKSGREAGVEKYLVFSTATVAGQVESINDFIINQAKEHEEFLPVGTMHIDFDNFEKEIDRIYNLGVKGIKLHPDFQKFNFDNEKMYPIYDLLEKKGMFVITHSGDYRHGFSHPLRVANIAKRFPKLRIIAAHCGAWSQWDMAKECLVLPNIFVDTSSTMGFFDNDIIKKTIAIYGDEKVFFGTDFPMWDHVGEINRLERVGLSEYVLEKVLYENFQNFYDV